MELSFLVAAILVTLTFIAHTFFGTKESLAIEPDIHSREITPEDIKKKHQYWIQSICAFQLVTVDLLLIGIILYVMAFTNLIYFEYELAIGLSIYFFTWSLAWLIQLIYLKTNSAQYYLLGHWAFFLVLGGVILSGVIY